MTGNANISRHSYKVERERKQYVVYELTNTTDLQLNQVNSVLTELIRIEKDRSYHRSTGFDEWLRLRTCSNWRKSPTVTGLMKTEYTRLYFGDWVTQGKKHLLIFQFNEDCSILTIDVYYGYCPYHKPDPHNVNLKAILSKYNK